MNHLKKNLIFALLVITSSSPSTRATTFTIKNNCPYTLWAAAVPGGGAQLNPGATWTVSPSQGTAVARIWARTGCTVMGPNGLRCRTGDCGGLLNCTTYGKGPNTLGEYELDQVNKLDFFDISLVDGFNVPMGFIPVSNGCKSGPVCRADVNGPCPSVLRAQGGCNDPCSVFKSDGYCCYSGKCGPTKYSRFFKNLCPNAFSYPNDYRSTVFTCPVGTNYRVTFCP